MILVCIAQPYREDTDLVIEQHSHIKVVLK